MLYAYDPSGDLSNIGGPSIDPLLFFPLPTLLLILSLSLLAHLTRCGVLG